MCTSVNCLQFAFKPSCAILILFPCLADYSAHRSNHGCGAEFLREFFFKLDLYLIYPFGIMLPDLLRNNPPSTGLVVNQFVLLTHPRPSVLLYKSTRASESAALTSCALLLKVINNNTMTNRVITYFILLRFFVKENQFWLIIEKFTWQKTNPATGLQDCFV